MDANLPDDKRREVLQVHFNQYPTVGSLVAVLQNLQTALRAAARSVGESPPSRSIEARRFSEGSLDFAIEVVEWAPYLVQAANDLLREALKEILKNGGPGMTLALVLQLIDSRRRRRRELYEDSRFDRIEEAIPSNIPPTRSRETDSRNQRRAEIEKISRETGYSEGMVAEAIRVVDRLTDAAEEIGGCDGGILKSPEADSLVVPPGWRRNARA